MTRRSQSIHINVTRWDAVECSHDSVSVGFVGGFLADSVKRQTGLWHWNCKTLDGFKISKTSEVFRFRSVSVPGDKTEHVEAAFSYYAPHIWSKLTETLKSAPTLNSFKSGLGNSCMSFILYYILSSVPLMSCLNALYVFCNALWFALFLKGAMQIHLPCLCPCLPVLTPLPNLRRGCVSLTSSRTPKTNH